MIEFSQDPPVPTHKIAGAYMLPIKYREDKNSFIYAMPGAGRDNREEIEYRKSIQISEYPDDALIYLYRSIQKVNNNIDIFNSGKKRWVGSSEKIVEELNKREVEIPNTDLTHKVEMTKRQALEVPLRKVPVIIKIGRADDDYELGTKSKEMGWEVLTTKEEAKYIKDNFESVTINKYSN